MVWSDARWGKRDRAPQVGFELVVTNRRQSRGRLGWFLGTVHSAGCCCGEKAIPVLRFIRKQNGQWHNDFLQSSVVSVFHKLYSVHFKNNMVELGGMKGESAHGVGSSSLWGYAGGWGASELRRMTCTRRRTG